MSPGDRVGRYVVEALLGEGGMGAVFRAYDATLRRRVALKLLRAREDGSSDDGHSQPTVRRILREARMAAALDHPNVVSIFDFGEHEGVAYIVMELVSGRPLREVVGAGLPAAERVRILIDVARALAAAHKVGLVHLDVKPENVLVRDDGVVKVLDFGIARRAHAQVARTAGEARTSAIPSSRGGTLDETGVAGTPAYMAPEQVRGEPLDPRADQFAWGAVAYELLSGVSPWKLGRSTADVLAQILHQAPAPLSAEALGVPESVVEVVHRALRKSKDERFATMDELLAALGVTGDTFARVIRSNPPSNIESAPTVLAPSQETFGPSSATKGRTRRAGAASSWMRIALGSSIALAGVLAIAVARRTPSEVRFVAAPSAAQHPAESAIPFDLEVKNARRLTLDPTVCEEYPSFTPDAKSIVFDTSVGADSHIVVLDLATSTRRTLTHDAGWQYAPTVSPDGSLVAYLDAKDGVRVVPLDGAAPPRTLRKGAFRPSFAPDGKAVWARGANASAVRVELVTGEVTRTIAPDAGLVVTTVLELPDGRVVARLDYDRRTSKGLAIYPRADGAPTMLLDQPIEEVLVTTPDRAHLVTARLLETATTELVVVPIEGGAPRALHGLNEVTKGLAIAKGGDRVAWSTCAARRELDVLRAGGEQGHLEATPAFRQGTWGDADPDGVPGTTKVVARSTRSGAQDIWVIDLASKEPAKSLDVARLKPGVPAVSADGKWIAFGAADHAIYVASIDGSAPPRKVASGGADTRVAFAKSGRSIFFETTDGDKPAIAEVAIDGPEPRTPVVVLTSAMRPTGSPRDDVFAYLAGDERASSEPRIYDPKTRRSRPLSPSLPRASYMHIRFAHDGRHVAVVRGTSDLVEVDAATGAVSARFHSASDEIAGLAYSGAQPLVALFGWRGEIWVADRAN